MVAFVCLAAACERHSTSSETYRITKCEELWPDMMQKYFGKDGKGGELTFPVKKRGKAQGGDWTYEKSVTMRPTMEGSIYRMAMMAANVSRNKFEPLLKHFLVAGGPYLSGWQVEDVVFAMMYNLKASSDRMGFNRLATIGEILCFEAAAEASTTNCCVESILLPPAGPSGY